MSGYRQPLSLEPDFTFGSQALAVLSPIWSPSAEGYGPMSSSRTRDTMTPFSMGQLHPRPAVVLVALQPSAIEQGGYDYPLRGLPPRPRPRALSAKQLRTSEAIFSQFRDRDLMPAYLADADPNRALLDRHVVCDLLGFDEEVYVAVRRLAAKWCAEPSVHGGKARPKERSDKRVCE